jgi:hypothetical protein
MRASERYDFFPMSALGLRLCFVCVFDIASDSRALASAASSRATSSLSGLSPCFSSLSVRSSLSCLPSYAQATEEVTVEVRFPRRLALLRSHRPNAFGRSSSLAPLLTFPFSSTFLLKETPVTEDSSPVATRPVDREVTVEVVRCLSLLFFSPFIAPVLSDPFHSLLPDGQQQQQGGYQGGGY